MSETTTTTHPLSAGTTFDPRPPCKIDPPAHYSLPTREFRSKDKRLAANKEGATTLAPVKEYTVYTPSTSGQAWQRRRWNSTENKWEPSASAQTTTTDYEPSEYHLTTVKGVGDHPVRTFTPCHDKDCVDIHVNLDGIVLSKAPRKTTPDPLKTDVEIRRPATTNVALPPFPEGAVLGYPDQAARRAAQGNPRSMSAPAGGTSTAPSASTAHPGISVATAPTLGLATDIDSLDAVIAMWEKENPDAAQVVLREWGPKAMDVIAPVIAIETARRNRLRHGRLRQMFDKRRGL